MLKSHISSVDKPFPDDVVRLKESGNIFELVYMKRRNKRCYIERLDSEHYIDLKTGEVKDFVHIGNRSDDLNSVRCSLGRLRDYLNANITDVQCCRWVTLTYAQPDGKPMTDTVLLYKDFKNFIKRLRLRYGKFEYIVAMEPQASGSWHAHVVLIFPEKAPFIPNEEMAEIWGQGFTVTKRLDSVDNVGAYLTAYLGDMELEDYVELDDVPDHISVKEVEYIDDSGKNQKKRYVKGGRLYMYPPNFNLYRCSRGCKKPTVTYMPEKDAEKKVSSAKLTFQRTVFLVDPETDFENVISYRYYNKVRK